MEEYTDYESLPQEIDPNGNVPAVQQNNGTIEKAFEIAHNVLDVADNWKQIDLAMHEMDVQLSGYLATLDYKIQKFHGNAPLVQEQLNNISARMDKIVDKLLEKDPVTDMDFDMRIRMLDTLDKYADKISTLMFKLLDS